MDPTASNTCASPVRKKKKKTEEIQDNENKSIVATEGEDKTTPPLAQGPGPAKGKEKGNASEKGKREDKQLFDGDKMYVLESGIGKARTNLFKRQIKNNGGSVAEKFSAESCGREITHLIVDDNMDVTRMCRILGIQSPYTSIEGLNVVKVAWLSACLKEKKGVDCQPFILDTSCLTKNDMDQPDEKEGTSVKVEQAEKGIEANEVSDDVKPSASYSHFGKRKNKQMEEDVVDSDYTSSEDEEGKKSQFVEPTASTFAPARTLPKGSWACAKASSQVQINHNKNVTDKLEALAKIYENTNDKWRALGYSKAIAALKRCPKKITTYEEAKALQGVGAKLANKVWEIIESGELRKLEEISSSAEIQAINLFTDIWGAGAATARQWVSLGYRTLDDIRTKANLNKQQTIGLKYYDELLDRIPRDEAGVIEGKVIEAALKINPGLICQACGSYRRGKATCGDVDVLVTHPDGKSHIGVFRKLLDSLHHTGFLTDDLVRQEDESTQKKYLGVCKLPGENKKHRRLDIIVVPYDEYACSLMYFTGSAHFNRSMRHLAGKMNMSLSEHSLNVGVVRSRGEKINKGTPLPTPTEESVFKHLGLPYRPPEERNH